MGLGRLGRLRTGCGDKIVEGEQVGVYDVVNDGDGHIKMVHCEIVEGWGG